MTEDLVGKHGFANMNSPVVYQIDPPHLCPVGFQDVRNRIAQGVVPQMTQMEGFIGVGAGKLDHHLPALKIFGMTVKSTPGFHIFQNPGG